MRILYITPAFHHPAVRGPTRCYNFIKQMSKRHKITLLSLNRVEISAEAMQEMASYTEQILVFDASTNSDQHTEKKFTALSRFAARKRALVLVYVIFGWPGRDWAITANLSARSRVVK